MLTRKSRNLGFLLALFVLFPFSAGASLRITEIMYDLDGTDTGREWIEIANDGDVAVDVAAFRIFEGGTNHRLTSVQGSTVLGAGDVAVIADDTTKFLLEWPAYAGILFDTSFSGGLSNSGEILTLRNGDLVDQDTVTYASAWGGAGDGNSLARSGSSFAGAAPSPGSYGSGGTASDTSSQQQTQTTASSSVIVTTSSAASPKSITVYAGDTRTALVGVDAIYSAEVFGTNGEKASNPRVVWNFGDGTSAEGVSVLHAYAYPGKYVVWVTGALGDYSSGARLIVTVLPAQVALRVETDGTLSVLNTGARDVDLSRWIVARNGFQFRFPEGTFVLAGEGVHLPATTHIPLQGKAELLYPNGLPASGEVPALETIPAVPASHSAQSQPSGIVHTTPVQELSTAAVAEALPQAEGKREDKGSALMWLMGALGIALLGTAALIFLKKHTQDARASSMDDIASTYEIIE